MIKKDDALAKVSELESLNKELKKALSDLLVNATAKARYISFMEGNDEKEYFLPDRVLDSPEMAKARSLLNK